MASDNWRGTVASCGRRSAWRVRGAVGDAAGRHPPHPALPRRARVVTIDEFKQAIAGYEAKVAELAAWASMSSTPPGAAVNGASYKGGAGADPQMGERTIRRGSHLRHQPHRRLGALT